MCAVGPWFLSFFSTPTLLTWLLFSWLILLLSLSCSSYVAPRPHLIHSFRSVLPFPPVPFLFALSLSCLRRGHRSTMFWVLAKHLASKPIHPVDQYVFSYNVCTQRTLVTACLSCQIQITGQREAELLCSSKNLISSALFCLQDKVGEGKNTTCSTVCSDNIESGEEFKEMVP